MNNHQQRQPHGNVSTRKRAFTALHAAVRSNDFEATQHLLLFEAKNNYRSRVGFLDPSNDNTTLHEACVHGNVRIMRLLMDLDQQLVLARNQQGETPLHLCLKHSQSLNAVALLLARGADVHARDDKLRNTPLLTAVKHGCDRDIISCLVRYGANQAARDRDGRTLLHLAASIETTSAATTDDALAMVKLVMELDCAVEQTFVNRQDVEGATALHLASGLARTSVVKYLVQEAGANVNIKTPLVEERRGNQGSPGSRPRRGGGGLTPLHFAAYTDCVDIAKFLLEHGAHVNCFPEPPLHYAMAARGGDGDLVSLAMLRLLLQHGANANAADSRGVVPLHLATKNGNMDLIQCLVREGGAMVNVGTLRGRETPLHTASAMGRLDICQFLLHDPMASARIDLLDKAGRTALEVAAGRGHADLVRELLVCTLLTGQQHNVFSESSLL